MAYLITGRIGLIGDPVEHSLSPAFQQAAFDALGIDVTYELWPTPAEIPARIAAMRRGEIYGANVTIPHKEVFASEMDSLSEIAERVGAVNTIIVRENYELHGDNTDVYGFLQPLLERDFPFSSSSAMIIGAGGAARAVAIALLDAGIGQLTIANRTLARAEALVDEIADPRLATCSLNDAVRVADGDRLVVNATSVGWRSEIPIHPDLFEQLEPDAIAYDLIYRQTPFLEAAAKAGRETIDGLPMLVHQGARSFEIWTGERAPLDLMFEAALKARAERE